MEASRSEIRCPRTHDIETLLKLLPNKDLSKKYTWQATMLTSFEALSRYDDMRPPAATVKDALAYAKAIAAEVSEIG
ncbi:MAG: HEPN domain-containing protein [Candidatus Methanoplasma sp.]|nr:HEPN domain-containing protein [Candidatus Methanoplasma sp.]